VVKPALLLLLAASASAELVVLRNGRYLPAERCERTESSVRIFWAGGVIEVPAEEVQEFLAVEDESPSGADAPRQAAVQVKSAEELVEEAARRYGLPAEFLHSVARVESGYRPDAVSPKGAIGIMQLMPGTAAVLQADPNDPEQNVDAGARHLRELLLRYEGSTAKALAAYHAGPGAVQKYGGVPPYRETQLYVEKVLRNYWRLSGKKSE
jgi:soluble lytic murein transglycosylase-like protein